MSEISMEQKLQLVQQVRSRYHEDRYDLSNRERLLYGKTSLMPDRQEYPAYRNTPYEDTYGQAPLSGESPLSFFRVRFVIAGLLLAAVIIMDRNGINVAGITTDKIYEMISADYEEKIEEWVEAMSR